MVSAWPYTLESRAYKHAIVHHESGESFSGDPFLDPLFDYQLFAFGILHNDVLKLTIGSPAHYLFWYVSLLSCCYHRVCLLVL